MAKRVHPLMSVSGNFGKYGGAHPTHATLVGAANKGPGNQVFFRGVIRAPEAARAALNATSNDRKSELRRRMDGAGIDPLYSCVLESKPHPHQSEHHHLFLLQEKMHGLKFFRSHQMDSRHYDIHERNKLKIQIRNISLSC